MSQLLPLEQQISVTHVGVPDFSILGHYGGDESRES